MKHDKPMLAEISKELENAVFEQDSESVRYWTEYRAEIMQQLVAGHVSVPEGMTADQVVDQHVARTRMMCEQFGDGLPLARKIIPPSGGTDGIFAHTLQQKVLH